MRISRSIMNWWLHSEQKFIGSFDLPWSKWSGISDPSKSLSSQRSTHPKWHRFLSKQFIGQTPLHHIHKFSFHWNLVIHKQPATVRNPISYWNVWGTCVKRSAGVVIYLVASSMRVVEFFCCICSSFFRRSPTRSFVIFLLTGLYYSCRCFHHVFSNEVLKGCVLQGRVVNPALNLQPGGPGCCLVWPFYLGAIWHNSTCQEHTCKLPPS